MSIERVPAMRSTIVDGADGLTFLVPAYRTRFAVIFLPVWLAGWVFGEVTVLRQVVAGRADTPFVPLWLMGWTVGGVIASGLLAWMLAGRERIVLKGQTLAHRRELFGLGHGRRYELAHVRNLRVAPPEDAKAELGLRPLGVTSGIVIFDYGAKTIRMAAGVDEAEGRMIVKRIQDRHPIRSPEE